MNEVIGLLESHRSIRKFSDQPIEDTLLKTLIKSGQHAPSSSFLQAYSVIHIRDPIKRSKLAAWCGDQEHIIKASVFLVFCGDMYRLQHACQKHNVTMIQGMTEQLLIASVDTAIMAQNVLLAAESMGIGGVYVGAIRNNPQGVSEMLHLPEHVFPIFGMSLGYPAEDPQPKPRLPVSMVLMEEEYAYNDQLLEEYDDVFRNYIKERKSNAREESWSDTVARKLKNELRPHMKGFLNDQGFMLK